MKKMKVCKTMCKTCPFRPGSKYAFLVEELTISTIAGNGRICHSTGSNNAINRRTGKPPRMCRGARDVALRMFAATGFLEEPTDKAWDKKCKAMGIL